MRVFVLRMSRVLMGNIVTNALSTLRLTICIDLSKLATEIYSQNISYLRPKAVEIIKIFDPEPSFLKTLLCVRGTD